MEIIKNIEGAKETFTIKGNLDTVTSPELQKEIDGLDSAVKELVFDFASLDYISSAGLRVMLTANKKMTAAGGSMTIANTKPEVREVFDMTGFSDIFTMV